MNPTEHEEGRCDECQHWSNDLTPLGQRELCQRCYRESIADLELLPPVREVDTSESLWEE